jgi:type 1 fimbria pilin
MNMKKSLFAFCLILFTASLGLAMTTEYQSESKTQKATKTITGEIVSVDSAKNEVVVMDGAGAEVRLLTDKSTKVTKEGKTISLTQVKPSEKVTINAEEAAGGWWAKSIQVSAEKSSE